MKNIHLTAFVLLALAASTAASAGEAEDKIFSISSGIKTRYIADGGDLKFAALEVENKAREAFGDGTKCTKRRAKELSAAFRELLDSTAKVDAKAIYKAAKNLDYQAHTRSTMYTKCWNHMVGQAKALGEVADVSAKIIAVGVAAGM